VEKITEVDAKRAAIVNTYFEDMAKNMIAVREELKQNGRYVIVVGDSNIRGQSIPTAKVLAEIAEKNGYIFELSFKYVIRDRYLHLPRGNRGGIIKYDEILVLKKK
jgi:exonuclease III